MLSVGRLLLDVPPQISVGPPSVTPGNTRHQRLTPSRPNVRSNLNKQALSFLDTTRRPVVGGDRSSERWGPIRGMFFQGETSTKTGPALADSDKQKNKPSYTRSLALQIISCAEPGIKHKRGAANPTLFKQLFELFDGLGE